MANSENAAAKSEDVSRAALQEAKVTRIPQYRRDLFPANVVLSADDLEDLCRLLTEANERAKNIEYSSLDLSRFESAEQARERVNDLIQVEYNYVAKNGDSIRGLGIPNITDISFPEELRSFFVSNATYTQRAINVQPLNVVDIFLSFAKPSLKIDVQTFPSNPTENKSVINVYGRDEDWVISTTNKIQNYFLNKKSFRPVIHGSGAYDYLLYLVYLPLVIWFVFKWGGLIAHWLSNQSVLLNVILGIYIVLLSLLFARFIFQYFRWLFPPIEYYKKSRIGAYTHRAVFGAVCSALILGAIYDVAKSIFLAVF